MKDRNEIMRFFGLHPQNDVRRRFAFTLAEVLVTLGIIGVVAVLTVPNVISSYQKKVYVAQLQKGYAQLQQVFDLAMADDEVEYLADTELMQSYSGHMVEGVIDQSAFSSKLGQYMKIQKVCNNYEFSNGCHDIYYFDLSEKDGSINEDNGYTRAGSNRGGKLQIFTKDGMVYYFSLVATANHLEEAFCEEIREDGGSACSYHADYYSGIDMDVNGRKGPNRYGRDMFRFGLDIKGQLHLGGSSSFWGKKESYLENDSMSCNIGTAYGTGCAAKIMDDGWKMDY